MSESGYGHERLGMTEQDIEISSDRSFGLVFGVVFLLVGLWPLWHGKPIRWWSLSVSAIFFLLALLRPAGLTLLNRYWTRAGLLLQRVMTPIVTGLLLYLTVTPTGLLMRLCGKDPLRLRRDPDAVSYWIVRQPPGPSPDTMRNQF